MTERRGYRDIDFGSVADRINRVQEAGFSKTSRPFVLFLGPSAVGKSTIIERLNILTDNAFGYVTPYTTRPTRPGESEKISVTNEEFDAMDSEGKFIYVNPLYEAKYGTPWSLINGTLDSGRIPILDFPLKDIDKLRADTHDLVPIYIFPENINSWYQFALNTRRNTLSRLRTGLEELRRFATSPLISISGASQIRFAVVNKNGNVEESVQAIIDFMLKKVVL